MEYKRSLQSIPDDELLQRLAALIGQSRRVEADVVAHIAEVEERGLYARKAFPSMFGYVREVLHLSEPEAYLRIAVARASRKHPMLLAMLADGRLHLTAIAMLSPHLTLENRDELLQRATHRSKHQVEELIAEIAPQPDVPVVVRKLPERRTGSPADPLVISNRGNGPTIESGPGPMLELVADAELALRPDGVAAPGLAVSPPAVALRMPPSVVQPLSPGRYKVQFTASAELRDKLARLSALVGNRSPADLAAIIEQAVTEKLERLEARRFARTKTPRKGRVETGPKTPPKTKRERPASSRHIPAAVRRAVRERDGNRCCYVDEEGRRCPERRWLEFHHRHPFGLGGEHSPANIGLVCRAHNGYLAERDYGRKAMASHRRRQVEPGRAT